MCGWKSGRSQTRLKTLGRGFEPPSENFNLGRVEHHLGQILDRSWTDLGQIWEREKLVWDN